MPTIINSESLESVDELLPVFEFTFDADGDEQTISDRDLNSYEVARGFAFKEFLEKGTDNQIVTFKTYARGLDMNDIISIILPDYKIPIDLTKNNLIVKEVDSEYVGAKTYDTIKAIRYD